MPSVAPGGTARGRRDLTARARGAAGAAVMLVTLALVALAGWRSRDDVAVPPTDARSLPLVLAALVALVASGALKALVWARLVAALSSRPPGTVTRALVGPVYVGLLANAILPARLGEPVRVLMAGRALSRAGLHVPLTALAGAAAGEVVVNIGVWSLFVLVAALALGLAAHIVVTGAVAAALVTAVALVGARRAGAPRTGTAGGGRWAVFAPLTATLTALLDGLATIRFRDGALALLPPAMLGWILQTGAVWALAVALHVTSDPAAALAVVVTTSVAQAFPLLPGSVGTFQAAVALPLVAGYGVSGADAVAFGLALHAVQAASAILPGLIALAHDRMDLRGLRRTAAGESAPTPRPECPGGALTGDTTTTARG